jgi:hypothetical protein
MNIIRTLVLWLRKAAIGLAIIYAIDKHGPRSRRDRNFWIF